VKILKAGTIAAAFMAFAPLGASHAMIPKIGPIASQNTPPESPEIRPTPSEVEYLAKGQELDCEWKPSSASDPDAPPTLGTYLHYSDQLAAFESVDDTLIIMRGVSSPTTIPRVQVEAITTDNVTRAKECNFVDHELSNCAATDDFISVATARQVQAQNWADCADILKPYLTLKVLTPAVYNPSEITAIRARAQRVITQIFAP